jgi:TetR/AcrR family transcriptional repressor of nem operon
VVDGCPIPALLSELSRSDAKVRKVFDQHVENILNEWGPNMPESKNLTQNERALATFSLLIGGLAISRAISNEKLSDAVLKSCQKLAMEGVEPHVPRKK